MKNLVNNKNYLIVLSRRALDKIEICNGMDLRENILKKLSERFGFHKTYKGDNINYENVEYLILIGIDTDEVVLETITSVEISEELKRIPAYSFSLSQYYSADRIVDCIEYLTYVAALEHKEWSDSLLLEKIFKDFKLNVDVLYETEDEYSFEEEFIQSKRLKAIYDFNSGVSPLTLYLSPSNISDGCSHQIEISQDYRISSINLGGALGESVARFGEIAENSIRRYLEKSYKWHDHLIWDVLVDQLKQTIGLYFKQHEQDLKSALQFFNEEAAFCSRQDNSQPTAKFTRQVDGTEEILVSFNKKALNLIESFFFPLELSFASNSQTPLQECWNNQLGSLVLPISFCSIDGYFVIEVLSMSSTFLSKVDLFVDNVATSVEVNHEIENGFRITTLKFVCDNGLYFEPHGLNEKVKFKNGNYSIYLNSCREN